MALISHPPSPPALTIIPPIPIERNYYYPTPEEMATVGSRQPIGAQPFGVLWRTALVRLPRMVPMSVLKYTSPDGPHPFIISLPSRGKHLIPIFVFLSNRITEAEASNIPVLVDFHGGGFFLGSCFEQAPFCSKMARDLNCVVLSVDYRMGPIDKFPAATEDAEDVISAILNEEAPGYKSLRAAIAVKVAENIKRLAKLAAKTGSKSNFDLSSSSSTTQTTTTTTTPTSLRSSPTNSMNASNDSLRPSSIPPSATASRESLAPPTTSHGHVLNMGPSKLSRMQPLRTNSSNSVMMHKNPSKEWIKRSLSKENLKRAVSTDNLRKAVVPKEGLKKTFSRETLKKKMSRDNLRFRRRGRSPASPIGLPSELIVDLDKTRIAVSGFSSGGNLALGAGISCHPPDVEINWPCVFPEEYRYRIPLLLYYPSVDSRQLPSERTRPAGMPTGSKFWAEVNDLLMPTYLPRDQATHPRASPGLVNVQRCLHKQARMLLVLPEMDNLAEQCEVWVKRVEREGRAKDLRVERFPGLKHGWTQMPESWLNDEERKARTYIFDETVAFVSQCWEGTYVDGLEDIIEQDTSHLEGLDSDLRTPVSSQASPMSASTSVYSDY